MLGSPGPTASFIHMHVLLNTCHQFNQKLHAYTVHRVQHEDNEEQQEETKSLQDKFTKSADLPEKEKH